VFDEVFSSVLIYVSCVTFAVIATILLPGPFVKGAILKDGSQITYKLNGLAVHFSALFFFFLFSDFGLFKFYRFSILFDQYFSLLGVGIAFSIMFSLFLHFKAYLYNRPEQLTYHSNNFLMNWIYGIELNPFILGFEVKHFSYRPAFIIEHLIVLGAMSKQYVISESNSISISMVIYQVITLIYIGDCFFYEDGILLMFDIIEENFGFMLLMGDYVWIPFAFSIQCFFIVGSNQIVTIIPEPIYYFLTVNLFIIGYIIFHGANSQKKQFRKDPTAHIWGETPKVIETGIKGKDLLISGWWGIARKINYLGDILIAISWSQPCGLLPSISGLPQWLSFILAYFYPIYLTTLLFFRAKRDDDRCRKKYGKVWDDYCRKVKYIIIPYIY